MADTTTNGVPNDATRAPTSRRGAVLGERDTAQVNEVLYKVIAHSLCVLIQSFYDLGVDPTFGSYAA